MGIWAGFDEADTAIHADEIADERAGYMREAMAELEVEQAEHVHGWIESQQRPTMCPVLDCWWGTDDGGIYPPACCPDIN